jgi:hypothetical protein
MIPFVYCQALFRRLKHELSEGAFHERYRMSKTDFQDLYHMLELDAELQHWRRYQKSLNTHGEVFLAACIDHLAHGSGLSTLRLAYGVSNSRLHDAMTVYYSAICRVIASDPRYAFAFPTGNALAAERVKWTTDPDGRLNFSFLDGAIGATDGTLIPIEPRLPTDVFPADAAADEEPEYLRVYSLRPYRCRKGWECLFITLARLSSCGERCGEGLSDAV